MSDPNSIVVCPPGSKLVADPDSELTAKRDVQLVSEWDDQVLGVVGWSDGGLDALGLAAAHPELPRLVILATPFDEDEEHGIALDAISAKTLLLFGSKDPMTGSSHGRRWQKRLPDARLEMVPGAGHELLPQMWKRVLAFLAPGRKAATNG